MNPLFGIALCFLTLGLISCSLPVASNAPQAQTGSSANVTDANSGALVESSTAAIAPDLSRRFEYLDSEKKTYSSGSLKEILAAYPHTVVYFYPKDGTPNCTIQALDFSAMKEKFEAKGYQVIGVSKDSLESHKLFADRNELRIKLLRDPNGDLLREFGAAGPLQEYGNGADRSDVIRSTFVVGSDGKAIHAWKDVKAVGHAQRVYDVISADAEAARP